MNLLERLTESERQAYVSRLGRPLPSRPLPVRPFLGTAGPGIELIAEFKRSSPSHGLFPVQPMETVLGRYSAAGASAISILVAEEGFAGSLEDLRRARASTPLPLLYKGFVSDPGQIDEAYAYGADAVLLITAVLGKDLEAFVRKASQTGLGSLVEVHREEELRWALAAGASMLGINNRDLGSLACDLEVFLDLSRHAPRGVRLVAESGYRSLEDIAAAERAGARAVLIGEALLVEDGKLLDAWKRRSAHVG